MVVLLVRWWGGDVVGVVFGEVIRLAARLQGNPAKIGMER
jgi:hypothetical protein